MTAEEVSAKIERITDNFLIACGSENLVLSNDQDENCIPITTVLPGDYLIPPNQEKFFAEEFEPDDHLLKVINKRPVLSWHRGSLRTIREIL